MRLNKKILLVCAVLLLSIGSTLTIVKFSKLRLITVKNLLNDYLPSSNPVIEEARKRNIVETRYPEFKDFDKQRSFAGTAVNFIEKEGNFYFSYIVYGSGVPIAGATCFKVDSQNNVTKMDKLLTTYRGEGIDIKTCFEIGYGSQFKWAY